MRRLLAWVLRQLRRLWPARVVPQLPHVQAPVLAAQPQENEAMSYREPANRQSHAWMPTKLRSSLDRCVNGCGWRRLTMNAMVARVEMVAYVRGAVGYAGTARDDKRRWVDEEPGCFVPPPGVGLTTSEWSARHSENRPSIHAVYDEFESGEP